MNKFFFLLFLFFNSLQGQTELTLYTEDHSFFDQFDYIHESDDPECLTCRNFNFYIKENTQSRDFFTDQLIPKLSAILSSKTDITIVTLGGGYMGYELKLIDYIDKNFSHMSLHVINIEKTDPEYQQDHIEAVKELQEYFNSSVNNNQFYFEYYGNGVEGFLDNHPQSNIDILISLCLYIDQYTYTLADIPKTIFGNKSNKLTDSIQSAFSLLYKKITPNGIFGFLASNYSEILSCVGQKIDNHSSDCSIYLDQTDNTYFQKNSVLVHKNSDLQNLDCIIKQKKTESKDINTKLKNIYNNFIQIVSKFFSILTLGYS